MHRTEADNKVTVGGLNQYTDGPPGTTLTADDRNTIQEELAYLIETAGLTLKTAATETDQQVYAAVLALITAKSPLITNIYKQDQNWKQKGSDSAVNRRTLQSPNEVIVGIEGSLYVLTSPQEFDLDATAVWDSVAVTDWATASNRAGKDFYVYACEPISGNSPKILLSDASTFPAGYTADTSRKVGGFHCLCVDAGTTGTMVGHDLAGYLQGDIIPLSAWDLLHRPTNNCPEGMAYSPLFHIWVDIYLNSLNGGLVESVYDATPHSGDETPNDFHWYNWVEHLAAVGKRLPFQHEFMSFSLGSNQETNILGNADTGKTGGQVDTASRRMISSIGLEDCCGMMQQWGADTAATPGSTSWTVADTVADNTTFDYTEGINRGKHYEAPERPLFGGDWAYNVNCGSRCSLWYNAPLNLAADFGARGICSSI